MATTKGEEITEGKTKGEEAYEGPSKGEDTKEGTKAYSSYRTAPFDPNKEGLLEYFGRSAGPMERFIRKVYEKAPELIEESKEALKPYVDFFKERTGSGELDFFEGEEGEDETVLAPPEGLDVVTTIDSRVLADPPPPIEFDIFDVEGGGMRKKREDVARRLFKDKDKHRGEKAGDKSKTHKGDDDYTGKKEKKGQDLREGAEKDGGQGTLAKTPGHGRVDN